MTPLEIAQTIESCRAQLEAELRELTGVDLQLTAHVHTRSDEINRQVGHALSGKPGWKIFRLPPSVICVETEQTNDGNTSHTAFFIEKRTVKHD